VKDEPHRIHIRRSEDPKLELGAVVEVKEGVFGVVLARFKPSGQRRNEVHYIVELVPEGIGRQKPES
jgi:hypothetical protein